MFRSRNRLQLFLLCYKILSLPSFSITFSLNILYLIAFVSTVFAVGGYKLGKVIIEGKTKAVYDLPNNAGLCLLLNKDRITAGDGVKKHDLAGKAAISNATNGKVFSILNAAGLKTAYVAQVSPTAFVSRKCEMIPIEWVTRRLATGSFCKRYPTVKEGYRYVELIFFFVHIPFCLIILHNRFVIIYNLFASLIDSRHQNKKHSSKTMPTTIHNGLKKKSFQLVLSSMAVKSVRQSLISCF